MFYRQTTQLKLVSTAIALSLLTVGCGGEKAQNPQASPISVRLEQLKTSTLVNSSQYVGNLVARQRVAVASEINGRIEEIKVKPGQAITKGQTLIVLDPLQQQEDVNAAIGNVNEQKARLAEAQANLRTLEAQRDATLSEVTNREAQIANSQANVANAVENLKRSEAQLLQAESSLKLAKINLERSQSLVKDGVNPLQDLDNKRTAFEDSSANVQAFKNNVEAGRASVQASEASVKSAQAAKSQAQKNVLASEERVAGALAAVNAQRAAIDQAEGRLGSINQNLVFNFVPAPVAGIVGDFDQYKVGDVVNAGQILTTLTDNKLFDLNVSIPIGYESQLREGLPVEIIKSDGTAGVKGQITYIAPLTTQNTQSILTKMTFTNDGSLRDNQFVRVRVIWNTKPGVLIPTTAVSSLGSQKFVFVANEQGNRVTQVPIQVGQIQGQAYQIIGGVKPGQRIAVNRISDLRNDTPITEEKTVSRK